MSHWLLLSDPVFSDSPALRPCLSYSAGRPISYYVSLGALKVFNPPENCYFEIPLDSAICYSHKPGKKSCIVRSSSAQMALHLSLLYTKSLIFRHLFGSPLTPPNNNVNLTSDMSNSLPPSTSTLYIDDDDDLILESSYDSLPSIFPSAFRSKLSALYLDLKSLSFGSSVTVAIDYVEKRQLSYMDFLIEFNLTDKDGAANM
ncbi:hypothetical protein C1646_764351 [Rhizophagus diaphanus]|nr:hypothetical protein C1646_764351 [Rhizophagus diaphanus] [Rhizophagus sp. MUCL 43196]